MVPATFGDRLHCDLCGADLPRTKRGTIAVGKRWCSTACSGAYWASHQWGLARPAALKRDDYRCVRCGSDGGTQRGTCAVDGDPWPCAKAGEKDRRSWAGGTYGVTHSERVTVGVLEVNHRIPRNGRGYHNGCHHHLEHLETLCRPCHVAETQKQRLGRRLAAGLRIAINVRAGRLILVPRLVRQLRPSRPPEAVSLSLWEVAS